MRQVTAYMSVRVLESKNPKTRNPILKTAPFFLFRMNELIEFTYD